MYIPRFYVLNDVDYGDSIFNHAHLVKAEKLSGDFPDKDVKRHFEYWDKLEHDVCSEYYIVDSGKESFKAKAFSCKGLSKRFSSLKYLHEIEEFAHEYGLLGIPYPAPAMEFLKGEDLTVKEGLSGFKVEPSNLWLDEIENIKKIMRVYSILKKYRAGLLSELDETLFGYEESENIEDLYWITWHDGKDTYVPIHSKDIGNLEVIYREVLVNSLEQKIAKSIHLNSKFIDSPKAPIGFSALEVRYSRSLLVAIYYDLWLKVTKGEDIGFCANPNCNSLLHEKKPRQNYCRNACKQEAYRIRKNAKKP